MIQEEEALRPIIITINTTADIFALNEPLKCYVDAIIAGQTASIGFLDPKRSGRAFSGIGGWVAT